MLSCTHENEIGVKYRIRTNNMTTYVLTSEGFSHLAATPIEDSIKEGDGLRIVVLKSY